MTPEQLAVERDALLACGRTLEEVERMQRAAEPGALLVDHRDLLREAYYRLCAVLEWTYSDATATTQGVLRVVRHLCERTSVKVSDAEIKALLSDGENTGGASASRPAGET